MTTKMNAFWDKLSDANLVQGDHPSSASLNSPWYVQLLLAISGWLGAIFLFVFSALILHPLLEEPIALFLMSLPLLFIAHRILLTPKNEFYQHMALAISLVGQALLIVSIVEWQSPELIYLVVAVLQLALIYFMPSLLHRIFSTVIAIFCVVASSTVAGAPHLLLFASLLIFPTAWLCLNEFRFINHYKMTKGIWVGLIITLLILNSSHVFLDDFQQLLPSNTQIMVLPDWFAYLIYIAAVVFVTWHLLSSNGISITTKSSKAALLFTLVFAIATVKAQGLGVGLIVVVLGFAHGNRALFGLGIFSLVVYSSSYYYLMQETLLFKSATLFAVAIFMLVSRMILNKTLPLIEEK